ncbi:MAG: hypothetical protein KatS3mg102_1747 [Planctomycetota bacterium]|nr:MAG: hypothetical protein KatS3mg102_1747 [Planctomycetota bacterium]
MPVPTRPQPHPICALCGGLLVRGVQPRLGHVLICTACLDTRRVLPDRSDSQDAPAGAPPHTPRQTTA